MLQTQLYLLLPGDKQHNVHHVLVKTMLYSLIVLYSAFAIVHRDHLGMKP